MGDVKLIGSYQGFLPTHNLGVQLGVKFPTGRYGTGIKFDDGPLRGETLDGLLMASSAPGYGRIWKIPVNFTIDRGGRLVDDGWKDRQPAWTSDRLERVVTPLLRSSP